MLTGCCTDTSPDSSLAQVLSVVCDTDVQMPSLDQGCDQIMPLDVYDQIPGCHEVDDEAKSSHKASSLNLQDPITRKKHANHCCLSLTEHHYK